MQHRLLINKMWYTFVNILYINIGKMNNTGCIYVRVSTSDKQDYKRQIDDLLRLAEYKRLDIVKIFHEHISGTVKVNERPVFSEMIKFIYGENIKHLLVWELSRIGRSLIDTINIVNEFNEKGINIHIKNENLETLDENFNPNHLNQIIISILSGFAQMERDVIVQRSSSGIRRNVSQGGSGTGKIKPYGFKVINKKLEIDEDEACIIEDIFSRYLEGYGAQQIANYLNEKNIPTRYNIAFENKKLIKSRSGKIKKAEQFIWRDATIINILNNTIYKGERKHKGEIFEIPAIVDAEVFDKVQVIKRNKFNKGSSDYKYNNIFKGKIICPNCGSGYFMHKRADGKDNAYKCLSKRLKEVECNNPSVNIDKLNNAVYQILTHEYNRQSNIDERLSSKEVKVKDKIAFLVIEKNQILKRIEELKKRQKKLTISFLDESIDDSLYSELNSEIISSVEKLNLKLSNVNAKIGDNERLLEALSRKENRELENVDIFKRYISLYLTSIKIFEVTDIVKCTEFINYFKTKNDTIVYVEVLSELMEHAYSFIISRYSNTLIELDLYNDNLGETLQILSDKELDDIKSDLLTGLYITEVGSIVKI